MGIQAEVSAQNAVDGTAAPNPSEIDATSSTESLQTITRHDPEPPRSVTATKLPEQEMLVHPSLGTSTSVLLSVGEAATPAREETPARVIPGPQRTDPSLQSNHRVPAQEDNPPEPEDITGLSMEMNPMRPTVSELEKFFAKYKSIVDPLEFDEFCSILGRKRDFKKGSSQLFCQHVLDCSCKASAFQTRGRGPLGSGQINRERNCRSEFVVFEDVDISCILDLDSMFNLDPRFLLHYVGKKRCGRWYSNKTHYADNGVAGS
jgi:hypothetical protein